MQHTKFHIQRDGKIFYRKNSSQWFMFTLHINITYDVYVLMYRTLDTPPNW